MIFWGFSEARRFRAAQILLGLVLSTVLLAPLAMVSPAAATPSKSTVPEGASEGGDVAAAASTDLAVRPSPGSPQNVVAQGGVGRVTVSWDDAVRLWSGLKTAEGIELPGSEATDRVPREWALSTSANGNVVALGQPGGGLYLSVDGGETFVNQNLGDAVDSAARYPWDVEVSGDGQRVIAAVFRGTPNSFNGDVLVASLQPDGVTFLWRSVAGTTPGTITNAANSGGAWYVASSFDGEVLVAARHSANALDMQKGRLWVSRDGGAFWQVESGAGVAPVGTGWTGAAVSDDGSRIVVSRSGWDASSPGGVYVGEVPADPSVPVPFEHRAQMTTVGKTATFNPPTAMGLSGDGKTLLVGRHDGTLIVSRSETLESLGTASSLVNPEGFAVSAPIGRRWLSVALSFDGQRMVAAGEHYVGSIWSSGDGGASWAEEPSAESATALSSVEITADGWTVYRGNGVRGGTVEKSLVPRDGGAKPKNFLVEYTDQDPYGADFDPATAWKRHEYAVPLERPRSVGSLDDGTWYWFRVAQVNETGVPGPWSNAVSAKTLTTVSAPGSAPQNLDAQGGVGQATVSWDEAVRLWSGLKTPEGEIPGSNALTTDSHKWAVSTSDGGDVVALGQPGGGLYLSADGGESFINQHLGDAADGSARYEWGVEVSGDGRKVIAARYRNVNSTADGNVWVASLSPDRTGFLWDSVIGTGNGEITNAAGVNNSWRVASSFDGEVLVAARPRMGTGAANAGPLWVSRDGGVFWQIEASAGEPTASGPWVDVAVSDDGSRIAAARATGTNTSRGGVYVGQVPTDMTEPINFEHRERMTTVGTTSTLTVPSAVGLSGDGKTLLVGRINGTLLVSRSETLEQLGTASSLVEPQGFAVSGAGASWRSVASSVDGKRLVVAGQHHLGSTWFSEDGGASWVEESNANGTAALSSAAITADGWTVYRADGRVTGTGDDAVRGTVQRSVAPAFGSGVDEWTVQYTDQDPSGVDFDPKTAWRPWVPEGGVVLDSPEEVTGLRNAQDYWFRVAASNVKGDGPFAGPMSARPSGPPEAGDVQRTVHADGAVAFNIRDYSVGEGPLAIVAVSEVSPGGEGTVTFDSDTGVVSYTPSREFPDDTVVKEVVFTYTVRDVLGDEATGTVRVTVVAVPVAVGESRKVPASREAVIPVLENDTGHELSVVDPLASSPSAGSVRITGEGVLFTAADEKLTVTDSFLYQVRDGAGRLSSATAVELRVQGVPTAPDAVVSVGRAGTGVVDTGALSAFSDFADLSRSVITVAPGTHGGVVLNTDTGVVTYTAGDVPEGVVEDSFTYTLTDDLGQAATGTVRVGLVSGPVARSTAVETGVGRPVTVDVSGFFAGEGVTVTGYVGARFGELQEDTVPGVVTYVPETGFSGQDAFVFVVRDWLGREAFGVVRIVVFSAPRAMDYDNLVMAPGSFLVHNVFQGDGPQELFPSIDDPHEENIGEEGIDISRAVLSVEDALSGVPQLRRAMYAPKAVVQVTAASHGVASIEDAAAGLVRYESSADNHGPDTVVYRVEDSVGQTGSGELVFTVRVALTGTGKMFRVSPGTSQVVIDPLGHTTGGGLQALRAEDLGAAMHGQVSVIGEGGETLVRYVPDSGWSGSDGFTARVHNDLGQSVTLNYGVIVESKHGEGVPDLSSGASRTGSPGTASDNQGAGRHSDADGKHLALTGDRVMPFAGALAILLLIVGVGFFVVHRQHKAAGRGQASGRTMPSDVVREDIRRRLGE
ncbi:Ig-like domain-containing protein [Lysinibacter sp. HNR]|uniref:Ig-like domain-containing protein n=1 Tax=Lysinibacter sp. HNR TaxID=3031408 RepID=UPI002434AB28|nr:Ig-like domain-containing protein [Lysinibacter sp. HNR]WGD37406.1 Ig-like domain-containing protein [Lysinibacter sp. HNR]